MEKTKKRMIVKIVCFVLAVIFVLLAVFGITVACLWGNEISTLSSFKKLRARNDENDEGSVYRMDVKGGFYFDSFLKKGGASSDKELIGFITGNGYRLFVVHGDHPRKRRAVRQKLRFR